MFPRYLFVRLDFGVTNLTPIRSTLGVSDLVRFGDQIPMVPDAIVNALKAKMNEGGIVQMSGEEFVRGQRVRIASGPLSGLQGVFQASAGEQRGLLLMEMLGKQSRVTVSMVELERVS